LAFIHDIGPERLIDAIEPKEEVVAVDDDEAERSKYVWTIFSDSVG
jgi:hypothetical protein